MDAIVYEIIMASCSKTFENPTAWFEIWKKLHISGNERLSSIKRIQWWWRSFSQQEKDWKTLQRLKIQRELEYLPPFGKYFLGGIKYREGNERFNSLMLDFE